MRLVRSSCSLNDPLKSLSKGKESVTGVLIEQVSFLQMSLETVAALYLFPFNYLFFLNGHMVSILKLKLPPAADMWKMPCWFEVTAQKSVTSFFVWLLLSYRFEKTKAADRS